MTVVPRKLSRMRGMWLKELATFFCKGNMLVKNIIKVINFFRFFRPCSLCQNFTILPMHIKAAIDNT